MMEEENFSIISKFIHLRQYLRKSYRSCVWTLNTFRCGG